MRIRLIAFLCAVILFAPVLGAQGKRNFRARLDGLQRVPPILTEARGELRLSVTTDADQAMIEYTLVYSGLDGATSSAVYFGNPGDGGGLIFRICSSCSGGMVEGIVKAGDILGPAGQGIHAGDMDAALGAIRSGVAFVVVGEIGGYIRPGGGGAGRGTQAPGRAGGKNKVKLCHFDDEAEEGEPTHVVIEVSASAVPAHERHGDCAAPEEAEVGEACSCDG